MTAKDYLYELEQVHPFWLIVIGVVIIVAGVWFLWAWAREDERKRREQRWQQSSARNVRRASTGTVTATRGTSTPTNQPSAPAGPTVVPLPETPAEETEDER